MQVFPLRRAPRTESAGPAQGHRPDIDGLRAIAVACVVLYHGFPGLLPGGFLGVDVFFVISGFLISRILFAGLDRGRLDLGDFYARRIRRIFPSLLLVLAATLAYGFVVLLPSELAALGKTVAGGAGFVANLILWTESGYFDAAASTKPLLHLWSLGVEEQFYLVWPLLLWLLARSRQRRVAIVGAAAALSFLCNLALLHRDPAAAFYWPIARLWELASGALLAASPRLQTLGRARHAGSGAGLAFVLVAAGLSGAGGQVLAVAGACLLIAAGPGAWVNRRILAHRWPVFLGLISYPLYLWHWPPIAFATILRLGRPPTAIMAALLIAGSVLAAWLTYRFVERPVRFGPRRRFWTGFAAGLMALELAAGLLVWRAHGFPSRFGALPALDMDAINAAAAEPIFVPTRDMRVVNHDETYIARIGSGPDSVLLLGDSLMFQYGPRVQLLFEERRLRGTVTFVVGASCAPVPGVQKRGKFAHCADLPAIAAAQLAAHPAPTVVLGAAWPGYASDQLEVERDGRRFPGDSEAGQAAFYANLTDEVAGLIHAGHRVDLILSSPADARFSPKHMIHRSPFGFVADPHAPGGVPVAALRAQSASADAHLRAVAAAAGARLLDPYPAICGTGPLCSPFVGAQRPKFADEQHLRAGFVRGQLDFLDPILTGAPFDSAHSTGLLQPQGTVATPTPGGTQ